MPGTFYGHFVYDALAKLKLLYFVAFVVKLRSYQIDCSKRYETDNGSFCLYQDDPFVTSESPSPYPIFKI